MDNINRDYVVEYIQHLIPEKTDIFKDMENYARKYNIPIISLEVNQFIKTLLRIQKPKDILEIGTAIGYSASIMAEALNGNCKITSIEIKEDIFKIAKKNIESLPFDHNIDLRLGDGKDVIPDLKKKYDFIFIDAAKGQYLDFFNLSVNYLNPGGIILSDNVLFKGMVASDDLVKKRQNTIVKRLREYLKYISNLEGYTTSIIPIGDGLALTYREV